MSSSKFIEKDIYLMAKAAVDTFGRKAQTLKACEELSELLVELHHELDGRGDEMKIAEELADAFFVLIQQISMLSNECAEHYVNKFNSIIERLEYKIRKARRRRKK